MTKMEWVPRGIAVVGRLADPAVSPTGAPSEWPTSSLNCTVPVGTLLEASRSFTEQRDWVVGRLAADFREPAAEVPHDEAVLPLAQRHDPVGVAQNFLVEDTRFWVVKPRIAGGQISGLGTLLAGSYIGADPGKSATERSGIGLISSLYMNAP